jgi:tellurite resistance protein TerC
MDQGLLLWMVFAGVFMALMTLDLGVLHRTDRAIGMRESLLYSTFYILIGLAFGGWIWHVMGETSAALYWTGFIVEKTLSVDNIFAISLVFSALAVPRKYQYRVLFWGILGSILMRGIMIGAGAAAVAHFHWILYFFSAFLIFTGIHMLFAKDDAQSFSKSKLLAFCKKHLRVTEHLYDNKFVVTLRGKRWLTPLMLALVVVNIVDVIFAVDSVPAILSLTTDRYLVFTSNIFAILGLRALYFTLDAMLARFEYLKYALSAVLVFIGGKTFIADFIYQGPFPPSLSLLITVALLGAGIAFSLYKTRTEGDHK